MLRIFTPLLAKINAPFFKGKLSDGGKESDIWWQFLSWYKRWRKKTSLSFILKTFFLSFSSKAGGRKLLAPGASFLTLALPLCYELWRKMFSNLFSSFLFSSFAAIEKCYHLHRLGVISRDVSAKTSFCWVSPSSSSPDLLLPGLSRFVALKKKKTRKNYFCRGRRGPTPTQPQTKPRGFDDAAAKHIFCFVISTTFAATAV